MTEKNHVPEDIAKLIQQARGLRSQRKLRESFDLLGNALEKDRRYKTLVWQHSLFFWADISAGSCILTRRCGADAGFIRELWANKDFIERFHRLARSIPDNPADLARILESEFVSLCTDSRSIHWIIRDRTRRPWGVLSLTDISLAHQRAEVLIGVMPGAPFGVSATAMLLLFEFFFRTMRFNKLYSLTYDDNPHSRKGAQDLGFREEGRHRRHVFDPKRGRFHDLVQSSLLKDEAFSARNSRLKIRLFKAPGIK